MSNAIPPLLQQQGVPFDVFIQSLTDQLDKAQASMALKARVGKLPLTFAVKELTLDLKAYVQIVDDDIYFRPAAPGDTDASTVKFSLTTITKPMIEENSVDFAAQQKHFDVSLKDGLGDSINADEQRRLERMGVQTMSQLNDLRSRAGDDVIARITRVPVNRLQAALMRAAAPQVMHVEPHLNAPSGDAAMAPGNGQLNGSLMGSSVGPMVSANLNPQSVPPNSPLLRLRGLNLLRGGRPPQVQAAGGNVPVLAASDSELLISPHAMQLGCEAELTFDDGARCTAQLPPPVPPPIIQPSAQSRPQSPSQGARHV
ncbi:hypothetical protein [Andreprevotia chitinilytica]|uniref:hypothetical protein n=1 Tax=Andreprevotia chitinilytica TaxID=396808 RepID=UPI000A052285|nr:hypothetical protein [Andreprevotia chitinilytica]